jgi:hypothetical protein
MIKRKTLTNTKLSLVAAAAALAALVPQAQAQSSDALIDKLVSKGILTTDEAKSLREESDKDFTAAYQAKTGMPDWVTGYKIGGDFRGRFEQFSATDNDHSADRVRWRYRLRFGIVATLMENVEVGFRLTSGDSPKGYNTGNPVSGNTTMTDNATKKGIYVDTAYAKWTAIDDGEWLLAATIGKMENPFTFTDMVFDNDYTPEGAAITGRYTLNEKHALAFSGGGFVLDEESTTTVDPYMFGGQVFLNSKWNNRWSSSVGLAALAIGNGQYLTTANVPYVNQGNTRSSSGVLLHNYAPVIADANVTYTLESFPLYAGEFPIKVGGELIENTGAQDNNHGYWVGVTFGKSGKKRTWDLTYRYQYLEADAWYDQVMSDDNSVFYQNAPSGGVAGTLSGTNGKGHLVKMNYSLTDFLTFSLTGCLTTLVEQQVYNNVNENGSQVLHVQADVTVKF